MLFDGDFSMVTFLFLENTDDTKGMRIALRIPFRPSFSLESFTGVVSFSADGALSCSFSFVTTGADSASVGSVGFVSSS